MEILQQEFTCKICLNNVLKLDKVTKLETGFTICKYKLVYDVSIIYKNPYDEIYFLSYISEMYNKENEFVGYKLLYIKDEEDYIYEKEISIDELRDNITIFRKVIIN